MSSPPAFPTPSAVFREIRALRGGLARHGIRIDSGDLANLSKQSRAMLDAAGFQDATIIASNELDEAVITELERQGARIDAYGVGTRLITAYDQPALGCAYKLVAVDEGGLWAPRLKRSENATKVTNPGVKRVLRFTDRRSRRAVLDLIAFSDEPAPTQPFYAFDPVYTWKRKSVEGADHAELLAPVLRGGALVCDFPPVDRIADRAREGLFAFDEEYTRLLNPTGYHVDLSPKLWDTKMALLRAAEGKSVV